MPISATRKAAIRAEIVGHAARLFRLRGHAGTNIDDIMLAAGLTRGAFYAHFTSKDDLFAEIVRMGHGLLPKLRAGPPAAALDAYLDREDLAANALACSLASLAGDIARAPLPARLAYANVLHGAIAELAKDRQRRGLDADATVAAILAVGAVVLARASGDTRLSDWLLRCARRAVKPLMKKPKPKRRASRAKKRSTSRRKAAPARPSRRAARSRGGRA
ncbi:MAG: TetR family transcriptional regulator [Reyranella sp.]|jgi:TetR/AcrR family transcriptional repressor of nem operon|nr:MAG: TetR family transcriptional regulator [Reyranella sp.]